MKKEKERENCKKKRERKSCRGKKWEENGKECDWWPIKGLDSFPAEQFRLNTTLRYFFLATRFL